MPTEKIDFECVCGTTGSITKKLIHSSPRKFKCRSCSVIAIVGFSRSKPIVKLAFNDEALSKALNHKQFDPTYITIHHQFESNVILVEELTFLNSRLIDIALGYFCRRGMIKDEFKLSIINKLNITDFGD